MMRAATGQLRGRRRERAKARWRRAGADVTTLALSPKFARGGALLRAREVGIGVVMLVVFGVTTLHNHNFASANSVQQLLTGAALIAMLGVGETMVIVTRNVDLSVGSVLGLSAYVVGDCSPIIPHAGDPGVRRRHRDRRGVGAINGFITAALRVPSLVVTLATLYIIRGSTPSSSTATSSSRAASRARSWPSATAPSSASRGSRSSPSRSWSSPPTRCGPSAPAATSTRSAPTPRPPRWPASPSARRVFTAFVISGALAGLGGALFLAQYADRQRDRRDRLRAARHRGGGRRRRRDLRRQRHRDRGRARRAAATPSTRRWWQPGLVVLEPGDRRRAAAGRDRLRPVSACVWPAACGRRRERT